METSFIEVNGVRYTESEYKNLVKKSNGVKTVKKRTKKTVTNRQAAGYEVDDLMKEFKVLDSLVAYETHGYRQWGTIHTQLMNMIRRPYNKVMCEIRRLKSAADEIEKYAKRNSRQMPSLLEEFSWKLDDMKNALKGLVEAVHRSEMLNFVQGEYINGSKDGKRLGLKTLTIRASKAIDRMEKAVKEMKELSEETYRMW